MPLPPEQEPEYRRLVISYWDLDEAVGFVSALSRLVERRRDTTAYAEALSQAFVVSYMRPFKYSYPGDNTACILDVDSIQLSGAERRLHSLIANLRDQTVAHSDPSPLKLSIEEHPELGMIPTMREPRAPFSVEAAKELLCLAQSVRDQLTAKLLAIGTQVSFRD